MSIVLYGTSSAQWWSQDARPPRQASASSRQVLRGATPSARIVSQTLSENPFLSKPLHCLVAGKEDCRKIHSAVVHSTQMPLPRGALCAVSHSLASSSPELSFIQVSRDASPLEAAIYGSFLCGTFCHHPSEATINPRKALTTKRGLQSFMGQVPHIAGLKKSAARPFPPLRKHSVSCRDRARAEIDTAANARRVRAAEASHQSPNRAHRSGARHSGPLISRCRFLLAECTTCRRVRF